MEFIQLIQRAKQIREKYSVLEKKKYMKEWTNQQLMQGFVNDVEDLQKILSSNEIDKESLAHELSDCLWSVVILADKYTVDLEQSFMKAMDEIESKIAKETAI